MSKQTDKLTDEEIARCFDAAEAQLDAEQRLEMKKTWSGGMGLPAASVTGTQKTPDQEVMEDFDRLLKESDDKIVLDAHLPSRDGNTVHKRFFVTPLFERFSAAAAALADFCPSDAATQADIDAKKADYGRWFASSLDPSNKDYRSNSDWAGEALCCVAWGLVRNRAAPKLADALSRFADTQYAEWFETTVKTHWDEGYVQKVGEALFECSFETSAHRSRKQIARNPKNVRDRLDAEANRFKRRKDWRADKPELAAHFEECFRVLSELFYALPRGQQKSFDPNSVFIRHLRKLGGDEIREGLATPGEVPPYCSGRRGVPAPFRGALLDRVRKREDLLRRIGVTADGLKSAYKSRDRRRQRSRLKPEDN